MQGVDLNNNFNKYSHLYDLMYQNKDYDTELDYFMSLVDLGTVNPKLLEVGSGTGNYTNSLKRYTNNIFPLELSAEMAVVAERKSGIEVIVDDISKTRALQSDFDMCLMLFHVINYITQNDQLENAIKNVSDALKSGGYFLFDTWHTPGVYNLGPEIRQLDIETGEQFISRRSIPKIDVVENIVSVEFEFEVVDKAKQDPPRSFCETHKMRPFSVPELSMLLKRHGLVIERVTKNFSFETPTLSDWSVCIVCQKK